MVLPKGVAKEIFEVKGTPCCREFEEAQQLAGGKGAIGIGLMAFTNTQLLDTALDVKPHTIVSFTSTHFLCAICAWEKGMPVQGSVPG